MGAINAVGVGAFTENFFRGMRAREDREEGVARRKHLEKQDVLLDETISAAQSRNREVEGEREFTRGMRKAASTAIPVDTTSATDPAQAAGAMGGAAIDTARSRCAATLPRSRERTHRPGRGSRRLDAPQMQFALQNGRTDVAQGMFEQYVQLQDKRRNDALDKADVESQMLGGDLSPYAEVYSKHARNGSSIKSMARNPDGSYTVTSEKDMQPKTEQMSAEQAKRVVMTMRDSKAMRAMEAEFFKLDYKANLELKGKLAEATLKGNYQLLEKAMEAGRLTRTRSSTTRRCSPRGASSRTSGSPTWSATSGCSSTASGESRTPTTSPSSPSG